MPRPRASLTARAKAAGRLPLPSSSAPAAPPATWSGAPTPGTPTKQSSSSSPSGADLSSPPPALHIPESMMPAALRASQSQASSSLSSDMPEPWLSLSQAGQHLIIEKPRGTAAIAADVEELENRTMPETASADDKDPAKNPRICCFDSSSTIPSWSASKVCRRCKVLNELLQSSAKKPSSTLRGLVGICWIATDCSTEEDWRSSGTLTLSAELLDLVVDFVIEDADDYGDMAALRILLHTASRPRFKIAQAFDRMRWYECEPSPTTSSTKMHIASDVIMYMWQGLSMLLDDVSIKRHGSVVSYQAPECYEALTTTHGATTVRLIFNASLNIDPLPLGKSRTSLPRSTPYQAASAAFSSAVNVKDACEVFRDLLEQMLGSLSFASPYIRSFDRTFAVPEAGAVLALTMSIQGSSGQMLAVRNWRYDTCQRRIAPR